jgi:hypothetical protein
MGRGLFALRRRLLKKRKKYPPHGKWRAMDKI